MNTPAHLVIGAALLGRRGMPATPWWGMAGGAAPDISLYVLAGAAMWVFGVSPQTVFGQLYFSGPWQQVFAIDNSVILWGLGLCLAAWRGSAAGVAFTGAALLHLALDLPLHGDDARMHFWPLTDWKFDSPYSYWDRTRGAGWIALLEGAMVLVGAVWLVLRFPSWPLRSSVLALMAAQLATGRLWQIMF
ncbi:cobalamin biosynthesis protein CobQ [Profundibacterium mesophilum]|uniref:Cobalamin biosynthesis protein CobQ n=1 Tax=Profundibacterium mesophilum KAUST100406-0324 TaxID=1037889 RepID=A0A921NRZ6_9RHOB|nr:cobalamin biosynthesis protein CobQ [Profundibacterium mesophilum]KAF0676775.1 hypothetical protein PMES_00861 [Profundibacterium mesophilum KAUST100406-0324]